MTLQSAGDAAAENTSNLPVGAAVAPCPLHDLTWVEFALVFASGEPLAGEVYLLVDALGAEKNGKLDASGKARVDIVKGKVKVSFPEIKLERGASTDPIAGAQGTRYVPGQAQVCGPETSSIFHTADWTLSEFKQSGGGTGGEAPPSEFTPNGGGTAGAAPQSEFTEQGGGTAGGDSQSQFAENGGGTAGGDSQSQFAENGSGTGGAGP